MSSACSRLLVANRGEIARRIFRTARAMGVHTVAVFSDGDAGAPFVVEADLAVSLGGRTAADTYLDVDKLIAAARRSGADCVHPGYGFLSENAAFASAVIAAGLTWIGPAPDAIAAMGDKLAAKATVAAVGVPVLSSVQVTADTDVAAAATEIGYPVLVKAAAGGGGKGMRVVGSASDLMDAVAGAEREAVAAFGDGTVFLERYLSTVRHVEVQVLGDTRGNLVHLFERECSIQRRHQKVVEESPSPAVTPDLRERMGAAALAAARAVGYHSAGTVEFLLDGDGDHAEFWFLEMNTRLQVEHPVTEAITGLDLVREQIRVARGEELGYGQDDLRIDGHAVEVRLYAEDPAVDFLPATGTLHAWEPPASPAVRVDSGVEAGSVVGVEFDPMLAKVISHAPARAEAAGRLALALERFSVWGVTTNRDFLVSVLRSEEFLEGDLSTDFIERVDLTAAAGDGDAGPAVETAAIAAAMSASLRARAAAGALAFLPPLYRNSAMPPERRTFTVAGAEHTVAYSARRDGAFDVTVGDGVPRVVGVSGTADRLGLDVDGVRLQVTALVEDGRWYVQSPLWSVDLVEVARFPEPGLETVSGGLTAPMPGKVIALRVVAGDDVVKGQPLVVLEAMKMEHTIAAPDAATVAEVRCAEGDQVGTGDVLVVLAEADDPGDTGDAGDAGGTDA